MKRPKTLSPSFVKAVSTPGRFGDGRGSYGLSLLVKVTSTGRISKSFSQRLLVNGKIVMIGLGKYPVISLAQARQKALENKQTLVQGRDPRNAIPTFEQCAERVIDLHRDGWRDQGKSEKQWRSSLETYVFPRIGDKLINTVNTSDLLAVLAPHWQSKAETMRRVKQRISAVMRWSVAEGYRTDDPSTSLGAALPKNTGVRQHHRALPYYQVGDALRKISTSGAYPTTKLCFEFMVMTMTRSGETRAATWDEIDHGAATWTIPGNRMKTGREHRIPLSPEALSILDEVKQFRDRSNLIFPSISGKVMSDSTVSKLLRENGINAVPHGFRASARDWMAECTDAPREIAEHCLAHVEGSAAELAYRRTDYFQKRREITSAWAAYLKSDNVIPIKASA